MNDLVGLISNHQQEFTPLIKLFIVMTFMMFLPTVIFMMTSFVRIIITFSFLKSALGAQQLIPNQILIGIALVLTIFIMSPVVSDINKTAIQPYREHKITFEEGIEKAQIPIKEFLLKQTREDDINLFLDSAHMDTLAPCNFGAFSVCTAQEHDRLIAFTSQMPHVLSNAYIKSPTALSHSGFSAGSYKDLTRVAWLNAPMWAELCMENRENMLYELATYIRSLEAYRAALQAQDMAALTALLEEGRRRKEEVDG